MPRTTADAVRGIYQSLPEVADVSPYIVVANIIVTDRLVVLGYSDDKLTTIELLLTCHLWEVDNPRVKEEGQGDRRATEVLETKVDLGLNLTRWGQQIEMLDNLHGLTMKRQKKSIVWLGEPIHCYPYSRG